MHNILVCDVSADGLKLLGASIYVDTVMTKFVLRTNIRCLLEKS